MKKLILVFLTLFVFVFPTSAKDDFETAHELFEYWEYTAYPDYICGIWSNDGTIDDLTFAVVEGEEGNKGIEDVLDLIKDDSTVKFEYQKYTKNYLLSIIDEMNSSFCDYDFAMDTGFGGMGLNEHKNRVEITFKEEKEDYQPTVDFVNDLKKRFGDAVFIEFADVELNIMVEDGSSLILTNDLIKKDGLSTISLDLTKDKDSAFESNLFVICIIILSIIPFVLSAAFVLQRRRALLKVADTNTVTALNLSRKDIEEAVKKGDIEFPDELDKRIMKKIDEC